MQKCIFIALIWLIVCGWAAPALDVLESGSASCSTVQFVEDGTSTTQNGVAQYSASQYRAQKFTYTGTDGKQICIINLWLDFQGSQSHQYYARLYADDVDSVGSVIGTSDIKELNGIGSSETKVQFDLSTPSSALTNSTPYWVGIHSTTADSGDYARWHMEDEGATETNAYSSDGSSWNYVPDTRTYKFEIVSQ